jgi:alpha-tubulin suppressor-like RCC1 family protein
LAHYGVRCWGDNFFGQLGDGTTTDRSTPPASDAMTGAAAVAVGSAHTCALSTTGGVRCWGRAANGELGDGIVLRRLTPTTVVGICRR